MKRTLWAFVAAIAMLAGCSPSEEPSTINPAEEEEQGPTEITYSVSEWDHVKRELDMGSKTRGKFIRYYDEMTGEEIAVTAVMPDNSYQRYINDETLKYQQADDEWTTPGKKYYWPSVQQLDFFALLPKEDNNRSDINYGPDGTSFRYTVPRENENQSELMYACTYNQTKTSAEGTVSLYFQHPLAAISFRANTTGPSISVDVSGIELHNVANSATFTFPKTTTMDPSAAMSEGQQEGGTDNQQEGGTDNQQEGEGGEQEPDDSGNAKWSGLSDQTAILEAGIVETTLSSFGEPQTITAEGGELFLIPQDLTAWNRGSDDSPVAPGSQTGSYLVITCRLATNGLYLAGSPTTWGKVYVPYGGHFDQGQHYTVTLTFGLGYNQYGDKNQIQVTTTSTIADWIRETINFDKQIL